MGSNRQKPVIIIGISVLAVIIAAILFGTGVIDLGKKGSPDTNITPTAGPTGTVDPASGDASDARATDEPTPPSPLGPGKYTCIIRDIDLDSCTIELYDIDSGSDNEFTFTAATDIKTSYGKTIGAALLKIGDIVDIQTTDGTRLESVNGDSNFKTHKDVLRFTIDPGIGRLTAGNDVYKYDDRLLVLDGERFIDISDLNSLDVISLFYRDNSIFFIKVVSSHGFLSFTGADDFEGATISLNGNQIATQVTKDLSLPLAVGEYSVYVENLDLSASADVRIDSHKTAVFDLSPFGRVPVTYGDVTFNIYPEGALLYIDGVNTFYGEPVSIPEGSHSVRVELGGYIAFVGTIDVSTSGGTFNISLPPAPVSGEEPPEDILYNDSDEADSYLDSDDSYGLVSDSGDDSFIFDDSTSDSGSESYYDDETQDSGSEYDDNDDTGYVGDPSGHKLIISCTEGTSVYINGNLAAKVSGGTAVCDKPHPGTVTVRLVLDGYISRTYTVTIEDDDSDAEFSFPDMVRQ
jgi:hypothetical protein